MKHRDSTRKLHLVIWMVPAETLQQLSKELEKTPFESITVQGDFLLPSHQGILTQIIQNTHHLKMLGCTIKVSTEVLNETVQALGHLKELYLKDVRVTNLTHLLDKCYNLREFKYHSLQNADILSTFNFT